MVDFIGEVLITWFKEESIPTNWKPDSIYFIKQENENMLVYVTDKNGNPELLGSVLEIYSNDIKLLERNRVSFSNDFLVSDDNINNWTDVEIDFTSFNNSNFKKHLVDTSGTLFTLTSDITTVEFDTSAGGNGVSLQITYVGHTVVLRKIAGNNNVNVLAGSSTLLNGGAGSAITGIWNTLTVQLVEIDGQGIGQWRIIS